jgi:hypothetical protein
METFSKNIILTQYSVEECIYLYNIFITDVGSLPHSAQRRAERNLECESKIKTYIMLQSERTR